MRLISADILKLKRRRGMVALVAALTFASVALYFIVERKSAVRERPVAARSRNTPDSMSKLGLRDRVQAVILAYELRR